MFVNNVYRAIDSLGSRRFEDGKIDSLLNDDAKFFLMDLDRMKGSLVPRGLFERIYIEDRAALLGPHCGVLGAGVAGLSLKKTDVTSIGDEVNPEFLQALKKTTHAYLTVLAAHWNVATDVSLLTDNCVVKANSTYDQSKMGADHCILWRIAEKHKLKKKLEIEGFVGATCITGKFKHLKAFFEILNVESQQAALCLNPKE